MNRRRSDWSPYAAPGIRRSYVVALDADRPHAVASDPELATPAAQAHMRNRRMSAEEADLYWITSDMARVALDASTDVPSLDLGATLPTASGIVFFDEHRGPAFSKVGRAIRYHRDDLDEYLRMGRRTA